MAGLPGAGVGVLERSRQEVALPHWRRVRQHFPHRGLADIEGTVRSQLRRPEIANRIRPGARVALGVGSRGIKCLQPVVRAAVAELREQGARPFIVPAMGSHGGATAEGQRQLLATYGITEEAVGAPVRASMETVELGTVLDGIVVHFDRIAREEADAVVPVARVKPHTSFRGPIESGLHKMLGIGFGKHRGASYLHTFPVARFSELLRAVGQLVLERVPVPFGLAIVEDAHEEAAVVEAVPGERFAEREPELLSLAREWMARLPFTEADVLVVQEIGKNISGAGMDPNVTGRFGVRGVETEVRIGRLVVLDLTPETHGNACGLGVADLVTARAAGKVDFVATYTNQVTAQVLEGAKLPLVAGSDREAVAIAVRTLGRLEPERVRLAWIRNTLELGELWVTEPLWAEIRGLEHLESVEGPRPIRFDEDGQLLR
jgi:hypothetical protein